MQPDFIPFALPDIGEDEIEAVTQAMRSGWLTTGPNAAAFEAEFSRYLGGDVTAIAVTSATAGLHLALEAVGVGPGDQVLVPTWTFTATAEVVRYLGADPVFVDVLADTLTLDFEAADRSVTARTKAVVPVHFAGLGIDRRSLRHFAHRHGLSVIEDAAHALPCRSQDLAVGTGESEAVAFSFYATKTMTTGEGGMVVVRDPRLAQRIRTMRLHGISRDAFDRYRSRTPAWRYEVVAAGYKYNLSDIAAALGRVQLRRLEEMQARREAIAAEYQRAFVNLPVELPRPGTLGDVHAWHLYVIRLSNDAPVGRDAFITLMAAEGVGCSVHFIPLHMQPYWKERYSLTDDAFPVASREFERVVSLPIYSAMSAEHVETVIAAVARILGKVS